MSRFTNEEADKVITAINAVVKLLSKHSEDTVRKSLINVVGCAEKEADTLIRLAKDYLATCKNETEINAFEAQNC